MLKDNLKILRNMHGFSQEEIAEKIHISRQAYAKWENGSTIPDIEKCSLLAQVYGTTLDGLMKSESTEEVSIIPPAPKGKNIWGTVTINDRGQIVIPKDARDRFNLTSGSRLVVLGDEEGIALISAEKFEAKIKEAMKFASVQCD